MIIQCDQCERKFRVDDSKIKPPGSRVRCSKCGNVFFVEKKEKLKTEGSKQDATPDLKDEGLSASKAPGDSMEFGLSASQEPGEQVSDSTSSQESDFSAQGKKDFVWTVNDIEAEVKAERVENTESPGEEFVFSNNKQEIEIQPSKDSSDQDSVPITSSDISSGVEWNSLNLDVEPSSDLPAPESKPAGDDQEYNGDLPFSAPNVVNGQTSQVADHEQEEKDQDSGLSTPDHGTKEFELDIDKVDSNDDLIPPPKEAPPADPFTSSLSVDQGTLSQIKAESYGTSTPEMYDYSSEPAIIKSRYVPKSKSFGSKIVSMIVSAIVGISILVIVLSVFLILSINFDILPKETTRQLREFLVATLPIKVKDPLSNIKISDVNGRWLTTLNGPLFVVSGIVTNDSKNIVNYVKIKSEFTNDGELLYDKSIYVGNTFTEQELQSLPLNDILVKLNRKNGDIDFSDPRKLAGKNYNIMPGESVEFYSVFPSENQILGLKYNIKVVDAEIVEIEQPSSS